MLRERRGSQQGKRRSLMYLFSEVRGCVLAVNVAVSSGSDAISFTHSHTPDQSLPLPAKPVQHNM